MTDLMLEADVAALLRRSRRYVRQLRQTGQLQWMPGAGRAPILITRSSVTDYIERNTLWQENPCLRGLSSKAVAGTSYSRKVAEAKDKAFGQKIFRLRKHDSRVG